MQLLVLVASCLFRGTVRASQGQMSRRCAREDGRYLVGGMSAVCSDVNAGEEAMAQKRERLTACQRMCSGAQDQFCSFVLQK